ncbi:MAG: ATP synthase F1 subunit epsilon [Deltaproteobacteria bacterium RIFCSPLOWO2_02_FULL_44_10]|nr:MAG: ATP synthase F1 subunit epsilon [Deltaproteobacteria bacterium RIFCSPHIGHO2_02_FULL_44_16]OGQ47280.1 MAG: ATP synthase F1 subunit epsilon [Deltaproteobacteria bacterium RIFCSPLOWO2_02_FULL_44_10]
MELKLITPHETLYEGVATAVTLPSADGEITILPGHAALLSRLKQGRMKARGTGQTLADVSIKKGFVEVQNDVVTVLVEVEN